jgi:hypothetical protein
MKWWWVWPIVGFFSTSAVLSAYKRYLYRGHPRGDGPSLPGPPSSVEPRSCDDLRVIDNDAFAQWIDDLAERIDSSGSDEAFTTRLMAMGFPTCPWPPADPLRWRITFEGGNQAVWAEFVVIVGSARV